MKGLTILTLVKSYGISNLKMHFFLFLTKDQKEMV